MAKQAARKSGKKSSKSRQKTRKPLLNRVGSIVVRACLVVIVLFTALIFLFAFVNPPVTHTIWSEWRRLGSVDRDWVAIEQISPVMARSVVAAEDANFCLHWGFDVEAIRDAIEDGSTRGASTLSQQVVKNVFLWQGRSWVRKALETALTPAVEAIWSKQRIVEVYLNVAEMDEGVFGVQAAAQSYFQVDAQDLTPLQAARIAAVLPAPKTRSASKPTSFVRRRTASIMDGAATIRADGRAACFED
ncbi:monofunctional biosynthetic peptidoglycan transglycosylase [Ruegeria sp. 2205SS24-7]|uniref:monofunctional biosynthetic peptidoglycan transglycosylase n=1 Tax=Ruegeria discodermiae TaxID=3064389 RepID=UPI002740F52A|nr:monofunctional biosynthetic peptidoglycan transglycosylase [Ruegeria sp. 2205SS24-7]MDP5218463.1 monofunctional biosynthetic peptidoglycan transglycosylase [Ruegeria sp. 2205SS24-7]